MIDQAKNKVEPDVDINETNEFAPNEIAAEQRVSWLRITAVFSVITFSVPTFMLGLEVFGDVTPINTVLSLIIGLGIITAIGVLIGNIGASTHLNSYLLTRIAFGDKGAAVVNLGFMISLLGWFGVNTNLFAIAADQLAEQVFGLTLPMIYWTGIACLFMTGLTFWGFKAINRLSVALFPLLAFVTIALWVMALGEISMADFLSGPRDDPKSLGFGISVIVGAIIVEVIILPDVTRFAKSKVDAFVAVVLTYAVISLFVMMAAVIAGAATGRSEIIEVFLLFGMGAGALFIVVTGNWVLNSLNIYSAVLGTKATFPSLNHSGLIVFYGLVGFIVAQFNVIDFLGDFLYYLSILFVPVAGIILVDFYVNRKADYCQESLTENPAYNTPALAVWGLGVLVGIGGDQDILPTISSVSAIDSIVLAIVLYWLVARLDISKPKALTGTASIDKPSAE